jgi:hypothetical protein
MLSREELQRAAALLFFETCQCPNCGHPGCEERQRLSAALERQAATLPRETSLADAARVEPFAVEGCTFLRCPMPRRCKSQGCLCQIRRPAAVALELPLPVPYFADADVAEVRTCA